MLILIVCIALLLLAAGYYIDRRYDAYKKAVRRVEIDLIEHRINVNSRIEKIAAEKKRVGQEVDEIKLEISRLERSA